MKTLLKTSLFAALAVFALPAVLPTKIVGSGNVVTETRSVSGFHSVELASSGEVIITQGDAEGVVVEAEDNLLPIIETRVTEGGTLRLGLKTHEELHYTKRLLVKALTSDKFKVTLAGSGNVNVGDLKADTVTVEIAGSGDVKLAGKATKQTVKVVGSGDYQAGALQTGAATVSVTGSGDCELAASDTLDISINGSGDVSYHGNPTVTKHVSGSGDIEALGTR